MNKKVPVLVLAFNRADHVEQAMIPIKEYKPERLYLACDGARASKEGEQKAVEETRRVMLDAVDWPCEVKTLFRNKNLGCAHAVYEAISWFFENEEWGIICEDDIILAQDFFKLCEDLLPRYANTACIQQITSQHYGKQVETSNTYTFQKTPLIWGWATWRRSWQNYMDMSMSKYPKFKFWKLIKFYGLFHTAMMYHYWSNVWKNLESSTSWATRWHFAAVANDLISICPNVNLALNIGISSNGAHYEKNDYNPYSHLILGHLTFPLVHPKEVKLDKKQLFIDNWDFYRLRFYGAKKIIKKLLKHLD